MQHILYIAYYIFSTKYYGFGKKHNANQNVKCVIILYITR